VPPLSLSNDEKEVLFTLAEPLDHRRRGEFLATVAAELEACPQPGPGLVHRVAAQVQRRFWDPPDLGEIKYARP
jgi:hypothetical protein